MQAPRVTPDLQSNPLLFSAGWLQAGAGGADGQRREEHNQISWAEFETACPTQNISVISSLTFNRINRIFIVYFFRNLSQNNS